MSCGIAIRSKMSSLNLWVTKNGKRCPPCFLSIRADPRSLSALPVGDIFTSGFFRYVSVPEKNQISVSVFLCLETGNFKHISPAFEGNISISVNGNCPSPPPLKDTNEWFKSGCHTPAQLHCSKKVSSRRSLLLSDTHA